MDLFFIIYLSIWISLCLVAITLIGYDYWHKHTLTLISKRYFEFLCVPWKLVTFVIATVGITAIAPYTGDQTWDYWDALFMSFLTFLTAPWAIGIFYLSLRGRSKIQHLFIALCCHFFSASWSYDLYLLLRDGVYPDVWLENLFASSILYIAAGLLWNLDWRIKRGATFSFLEPNWPVIYTRSAFRKIFWVAAPFMLIASCSILYFVI